MGESGGASSISKPYFLLEICNKIILRTAASFCVRTTGQQLKTIPWSVHVHYTTRRRDIPRRIEGMNRREW